MPPLKSPSLSGQHDIVYEVFVRSFCDSNSDGIGDIPGLISRLDDIRDLGVTAIWITPVHPSPSYHMYDVTDYYGIHPDFGTMEDMDRLITAVHERGMKLILDLVINHTSSDHPWFKASASSPENPFRAYYVWEDFEKVKDAIFKKSATFDSDNLTQWHEWPGDAERYYGFFWKGMPDLNFDHPMVREEVYAIGRFWLNKGIDGFRLDAAKHIYPDDRMADTRLFWEEFTTTMRKTKPDALIVGEIWGDPHTLAGFLKGLPSLFNFELAKGISESILHHQAQKCIDAWSNSYRAYHTSGVPYEDAILLSNHDMNRIRSTLGDDIGRTKLAASILLTLPGTPYIYYGEEIGMLGVKPDIHLREPFVWDIEDPSNTTWQESKYSVIPQVIPLDEQRKDSSSLYRHYTKWIGLRKDHPALAGGIPEFQDLNDPTLLAWMVKKEKKTYWVVHNLSEEEKTITLRNHALDLTTRNDLSEGDSLSLAPWTSTLLLIRK